MVTLLDIARAQKKYVVDNLPFWWGCIHTGQDRPCRISETGHENNATLFKKNLWKIKGYHENVGFQQTEKDIWYSFIGGFQVPCLIPGGSPWFEPAWSATKSSYEMGGRNGGPGRYDLFRRDADQEQIGVHWVGLSWFDHIGVICAERVFMAFSWVSNVRTKHNDIMLNCPNDTWD